MIEKINRYLKQDIDETASFDESLQSLSDLFQT